MAFSGELGMEIDLRQVPVSADVKKNFQVLFSESNSRFIVEVAPENKDEFESIIGKDICAIIGTVTNSKRFTVTGINGKNIIDKDISSLKEAWQAPLRGI